VLIRSANLAREKYMSEDNINFICEQNGESEVLLKRSISLFFKDNDFDCRAYLVKVSCFNTTNNDFNVLLCLKGGERKDSILSGVGKVFKNIFGSHEYLDIIFIDDVQEKAVRSVCCPFYVSGDLQIDSPDFYLTSSEGYELELVRSCTKRKMLLGTNPDGYMLCDIFPSISNTGLEVNDHDITQLIFTSRHKGVSIFNHAEWPIYVHIAIPINNSLINEFCISDEDIKLIGWGEIYNNKSDIRESYTMNLSELKEKLDEANILSQIYSLEGGYPSEKYCIEKNYDKWWVYYCERGIKRDKKEFDKEDDACNFLYKLLISDPITRSK
jgi:hypothetical protein